MNGMNNGGQGTTKKTLLVGCFIGIAIIIAFIVIGNMNHEHEFGKWTVVDKATCLSGGLEERRCKCGETITRTISALGHTEIIDEEVAATCMTTGLTRGRHCTECSQVIVAQQTTAKLNHIAGTWIVDKEASHTKDGSRYIKCTMCGKELQREVILSGQNKMEYTLLSNNTYEVSGIGTCSDREIIIPSVYNGLPVSRIGYKAFEYCGYFVSITIPDSIKSIEERAFDKCENLETIVMGNGVTSIGMYAFADCKTLKNITIPSSVKSIAEGAFSCCSNLEKIVIPNSVTTIGDRLFEGCSSLASVTLPSNLRVINEYMFYSCDSLKTVVIPDGVTSIERKAFAFCDSLTTVIIPQSVKNIGGNVFTYCKSLHNFQFRGTMQEWDNITKVEGVYSSIDGILDWDYYSGDFDIQCTDGYVYR